MRVTNTSLFLYGCLLFNFACGFFVYAVVAYVLLMAVIDSFVCCCVSSEMLMVKDLTLLTIGCCFLAVSRIFCGVVTTIVVFKVVCFVGVYKGVAFGGRSLNSKSVGLVKIVTLKLNLVGDFIALFFKSLVNLVFSVFSVGGGGSNVVPFKPFLLVKTLMTLCFSGLVAPLVSGFVVK